MVFDLRGALLKKEEFESARLMDFEFRLRARSTRKLAERCGLPVAEAVRGMARHDEPTLLADIAGKCAQPLTEIIALYENCKAEARAELVAELGDPSPYKLA